MNVPVELEQDRPVTLVTPASNRRRRVKTSTICILAALTIIIGIAVLVGVLPLSDPNNFTDNPLVGPSRMYPMGTDNFGRDVFSRVMWGTRSALLVAVGSAGISVFLGMVLGSIAGFFGGWVDDVLSRVFDIFLLVPAFFLLILLVALFGSSMSLIMAVIGFTIWPSSARIMRSQTLTYRTRTYVEAARGAGAGPIYLLVHHIVPNAITPVITNATVLMGQAILIEAGLSYLGLGDPNTISWGRMIFDGETYLTLAPWMSIFPGAAMLLTVLVLNLAGDSISSAIFMGGRRRHKRKR
jgi:peptide/nickel transport system permease protein